MIGMKEEMEFFGVSISTVQRITLCFWKIAFQKLLLERKENERTNLFRCLVFFF